LLCCNILVRAASSETTTKQDGVFDWTFAWQELRREQGVDEMPVKSDARFALANLLARTEQKAT
jgi:hypothetical protein